MRNWNRAQINVLNGMFEAGGLALVHNNGFAGVAHGPAQRVDVFFRFNANGSTKPISGKHVHGCPMPRTLLDVGVNRHGMTA